MTNKLQKPLDPYSNDWRQFWSENPGCHRGIGAEAAEDLSGEAGESGESAEPQVADWASGIEDDGLKGAVGKFESQDAALSAIGYKAPDTDWRDGLPEDLRKTADRFNSREDAVRSIENFRKREGQVRVPGKDASEDEISAYHKAIGVPESADAYDFAELGDDATEDQIQSRDAWNNKFLELNVPNNTAKELLSTLKEETQKAEAAQVQEDKAFAQQQDDALKTEWKGEAYEQNKTLANRAFSDLASRAGVNIEDLQKIETKDGRFLMDNASMSRIFAVVGKEMSEGTIGPTLTGGERETVESQIEDLRTQITDAQNAGNSKKANSLYQKEQALIGKLTGNNTVVGSQGRAV